MSTDEDDTESDTHNPIQPETPTTVTTPETSGNDGGQSEATLTQEQVNRIVTEQKKRAKDSGYKELLAELGVDDVAEAKGLLAAEKQRQQDEMSEVEQLRVQLAEKEAAIETANAAVEAAKQQRITDQRNAALRKAIAGANPVHEEAVFNLVLADDLEGVVDAEGNINADAITTLVEAMKTASPELFIESTPGVPSNRGGKNPAPNQKKVAAMQEEISHKYGDTF